MGLYTPELVERGILISYMWTQVMPTQLARTAVDHTEL